MPDMEYTRYKFDDIFQELPDGSLTPKRPIEINGIMFGPGTFFQKGVVFGGIDFHLYKGRDIAIIKQPNSDGPLKFGGFYTL